MPIKSGRLADAFLALRVRANGDVIEEARGGELPPEAPAANRLASVYLQDSKLDELIASRGPAESRQGGWRSAPSPRSI